MKVTIKTDDGRTLTGDLVEEDSPVGKWGVFWDGEFNYSEAVMGRCERYTPGQPEPFGCRVNSWEHFEPIPQIEDLFEKYGEA